MKNTLTEIAAREAIEALQAEGRVVAMGRPQELAERFKCRDLDEVFIYLARVA